MHSKNHIKKNRPKHPVTFRVNAREHALLKAQADATGLSQGEYLRRILVSKVGNEPEESAAEQAADAALVAAQMTAQVWAHLHVMLRSSPTETEQIETTFSKIQNQYLPAESGDQEE